jgi:hypothetical protein
MPTVCIVAGVPDGQPLFPVSHRQMGPGLVAQDTQLPSKCGSCCQPPSPSRSCVTVIAVVLAFFGALAFASYDWKGRSLYQKIILLPIFFPQSVHGAGACSLWFNTLGLPLSWKTAVFAHLVWIVPVVTLVISIQVYSFDPALEEAAYDLGASRWQVLREVTCRCSSRASSPARCSPSCCPGAISRCRSSPPGPTRPCPNISTPRWWRAIRQACRCSAPSRPSGAIFLLLGGLCPDLAMRRGKAAQ